MPKRRRQKRKTNYLRHTNTALSTAAKALTVAYGVKKLLNVERKFDDLSASGSAGTTEVVSSMFTIPQGDTAITRDGYSLKPVSLQVMAMFRANSSAATGSQFLHFFIGQMKNDTSPSSVTWYNSGPSGLELKNLDASAYANIIYSVRIPLNSEKPTKIEKFFSQKQLRRIQYDDTDTAGTSYRNGQLFWGIASNDNTNAPTYNIAARLRYVDN